MERKNVPLSMVIRSEWAMSLTRTTMARPKVRPEVLSHDAARKARSSRALRRSLLTAASAFIWSAMYSRSLGEMQRLAFETPAPRK